MQHKTILRTSKVMGLGKNVGELMRQRGVSYGDVARALGTDPQAIHFLVKKDSQWSKYAPGLASYFGVTLQSLLFNEDSPKVTEPLAPYVAKETNTSHESQAFRMAPVISWIQAGNWCDANDPFVPGDAEEWLPVPGKASLNTYALRVRGISMEPEYQDGDVIFVDPNREPEHGKHVVVRLDNQNEATFKQLIREGDKRYLKPLNPDWPEKIIPVSADSTICGVVIGKWVDK